MNWQDHLNNFTAETVMSAAKALDYLDGYQIKHVESVLNDPLLGIKKWKERGVVPVVSNLTGKIIERSALTYQKEPERIIYIGETENEAATDKYNDLLGYDGLVAVNGSDIVSRLLKVAMVLVQYSAETKSLIFSSLHRGNCDVDYDLVTKTVRSVFYTAGGVGPTGGKLFHYWDAEKVVDIEQNNQAARVVSQEANPYGMIPLMVRYDIAPPRSGFWPKPAWEELIRANEVVNLFNTEVRHGSRMQNFSPLFTNADIQSGTAVGPDAIIKLESMNDNIYLEYKTPTINVTEFKAWIDTFQDDIADNWGVNLKISGGSAADSGFKLIVEETWNLETRKQRQKSARVAERMLFQVVKKISDTHNLGIPDGQLYVDFKEPSLAVDTVAERQEDRNDFAAGLMSREQIWIKNDPDLTDEDIAKRKEEIDGTNAKLPDFTNAIN